MKHEQIMAQIDELNQLARNAAVKEIWEICESLSMVRGADLSEVLSRLREFATRTLGTCQACEAVFCKQGKKLFCDAKCTNVAMSRRKRARDAA